MRFATVLFAAAVLLLLCVQFVDDIDTDCQAGQDTQDTRAQKYVKTEIEVLDMPVRAELDQRYLSPEDPWVFKFRIDFNDTEFEELLNNSVNQHLGAVTLSISATDIVRYNVTTEAVFSDREVTFEFTEPLRDSQFHTLFTSYSYQYILINVSFESVYPVGDYYLNSSFLLFEGFIIPFESQSHYYYHPPPDVSEPEYDYDYGDVRSSLLCFSGVCVSLVVLFITLIIVIIVKFKVKKK